MTINGYPNVNDYQNDERNNLRNKNDELEKKVDDLSQIIKEQREFIKEQRESIKSLNKKIEGLELLILKKNSVADGPNKKRHISICEAVGILYQSVESLILCNRPIEPSITDIDLLV